MLHAKLGTVARSQRGTRGRTAEPFVTCSFKSPIEEIPPDFHNSAPIRICLAHRTRNGRLPAASVIDLNQGWPDVEAKGNRGGGYGDEDM